MMSRLKKATDIHLAPIGIVHSCFDEKFGIPRQPGLVPEARGTVELFAPYGQQPAVSDLSAFSHIWILFLFHANAGKGPWRPTVRPPRLGGNRRMGVFATRSGFRPNPIGQSVVALKAIESEKGTARLHVQGLDLLDGTPVIDIKPYLPYADCIPSARADVAHCPPAADTPVVMSEQAIAACRLAEESGRTGFAELITAILAYDPRPAYYRHRPPKSDFGMRLWGYEIKWRYVDGTVRVVSITAAAPSSP